MLQKLKAYCPLILFKLTSVITKKDIRQLGVEILYCGAFDIQLSIEYFILTIIKPGPVLFSLGLGQSKVLVLRFGPKINTKVGFNTITPKNKLGDQF